ncbi:MAG: Glutamyl-tRNA synthetase @ Glutamyl-tRNA(Gln) synthetase [uncultured Solirubrobacteraceae bacterium]|uniref:Glutamate--tRNA ligase n=1 Tax=uncultured Solirubrobacteraceae bacterium TaxID=1162706 RepID=A0A6J4RN95_9ACTN|nr:MAG: Glutamyl-tRNA synthetase @ Glutamyl-tRNA(Gln) synthetase [uncultured Solirubrobacteraceae bacterium]
MLGGMRVRFAPSPTGALHIGGARTALFNWLLARGSGGTMLLRIEDTDRERSTPGNVEQIFEALRWLEVDWDEEPVFQHQRADAHAAAVGRLLDAGLAYRSTAGPDEVRAYKEAHGNRGYRGRDEGSGAVRLRVPDEGATTVSDVIRGESAFENALQDDLVIARADGTPVYHLAVVVDDADAGITHVVRGADHYSNTPKHMLIQQALGVPTPVYAHVPLLHGTDGKKLSKRHGAASVQELRERGYLPEAVRNYLALLGWGFDEETTFFSTEALKEHFSLERVSKSPAVFDEQKLRWMNGRYLRELPVGELTRRLEDATGRTGLEPVVAIAQEKISTLDEFWPLAASFFDGPVDDPRAREKVLGKDGALDHLAAVRPALDALPEPWTPAAVEQALAPVVERLGVKAGQVYQPLRVALTGTTISPGIFETVSVLGRDESLARLDGALSGASPN